ncbi:MAG: hypothetical protein MPN21_18110 [Thermoanaerobaculia bacterium]|nr:hypothetical protein [Thermoanaerobaculia bacterium]
MQRAVDQLESFVRDHPDSALEAEEVAQLRNVVDALGLSIATAARGEMAMLDPILRSVIVDAPEIPNNREELLELMETAAKYQPGIAEMMRQIDLTAYEQREGRWVAVFTHRTSGKVRAVSLDGS